MVTERIAGFENLVGRWDAERHQAALADGRHVYFIAQHGSDPIGFAIIRDWASPEQVTQLKRIAVSLPGVGHGKAILTRLIDVVFLQTETHRFWLGVFPENGRARRAYEQVGVRAEGIAPDVHSSGGSIETG